MRKRTCKEAVELYQELQVDIVALGRLAVRRLDVVAVEIDTYGEAIVSPKYSACSFGFAVSQGRGTPRSQKESQREFFPLAYGGCN